MTSTPNSDGSTTLTATVTGDSAPPGRQALLRRQIWLHTFTLRYH